jgi:hypothetical protein
LWGPSGDRTLLSPSLLIPICMYHSYPHPYWSPFSCIPIPNGPHNVPSHGEKFLFWIPGGSPWIPGPAKAGDGRTSKRARDHETSRGPWNSRKSTPKNPSSARPAGVGRTPKKGRDQSNYSGDPRFDGIKIQIPQKSKSRSRVLFLFSTITRTQLN